ncbi:MAG: hypothetical protein BWY67_02406 [Bacteroidetes bacterium ADurb.Bin397]|nr:MAG: hypothetical protein BWY67_02406 [Bacteroidetes bacterium ADurb.Bin397]
MTYLFFRKVRISFFQCDNKFGSDFFCTYNMNISLVRFNNIFCKRQPYSGSRSHISNLQTIFSLIKPVEYLLNGFRLYSDSTVGNFNDYLTRRFSNTNAYATFFMRIFKSVGNQVIKHFLHLYGIKPQIHA